MPPGAAGELYIGGGGVARGYLGRPELTAERFVPDPFGGAERLATAPATWRAAGRTATSSSWAAATSRSRCAASASSWARSRRRCGEHPAVREAVVVAREDRPGDKRLVAYVVARDGRAEAGGAARASCARSCRSTWCRRRSWCCDALPLTANGKVDRRALPAPEAGRRAAARRRAAPRTATEAVLARIWAAGARACERVGVARQLLRAGRRLDPEHPGRGAGRARRGCR